MEARLTSQRDEMEDRLTQLLALHAAEMLKMEERLNAKEDER